jgi:Mrp family chromosome partitioning ATPase
MSKIYEALQLARREQARAPIPPAPEADTPAAITTLPLTRPGVPGLALEAELKLGPEMSRLAAVLNRVETEDGCGLVIHMVSVHAGAGASTVARALCRHLASHARRPVLLLDADPEAHPGNGALSGARGPGVADRFLEGQLIDGGISVVGNSLLHIGRLAEDPAVISSAMERNAMAALYDHLRHTYAMTIIDCPPSDGVSDLIALARHADGVVLLVQAGRTRAQLAARVRDMIRDAGGRVLGVVLNRRRNHIPGMLYKLI